MWRRWQSKAMTRGVGTRWILPGTATFKDQDLTDAEFENAT
jgi:hypothetical protein